MSKEFDKLYNEHVDLILSGFRNMAGEFDDAELAATAHLFALCDILADTDIDVEGEFGFKQSPFGADKEDMLYIEYSSCVTAAVYYTARVLNRFKKHLKGE